MKILLGLDIDGVIRDVSRSYRRALADTVEHYTQGAYRPSAADVDRLKGEGIWNNDWEASQELIRRYFNGVPPEVPYEALVTFFQSRYLGQNGTGYIQDEPLLITKDFFERWDQAQIPWGFVSGASRTSAEIVLCQRLGLSNPPLVAMGEAPDKPDPGGILRLLTMFSGIEIMQVVYCGDTVADLHAVQRARQADPARIYRSIGILPPHNQSASYANQLLQAGADLVIPKLQDLEVTVVQALFTPSS